jgi:hypothetical protein
MRGMPKSQVTVLLAIGLIAGSLCLLAACSRSGVHSIEDMKAGDCYNEMDDIREGEIVPCDTPHDTEVVAANVDGVSVSRSGSDTVIEVGVGGAARLADCLGVPTEEADAIVAERGLFFTYYANFDAFIIKSKSGKLIEAICR